MRTDGAPSAFAVATAADVMARWLSMYGSSGVGLQGGRFTVRGGYFASPHPVVRWRLHQVAWVRDLLVDGSMRWYRRNGRVVRSGISLGDGRAPQYRPPATHRLSGDAPRGGAYP